MEHALHEHVARFFHDLVIVLAVDGVHQLVRLFDHVFADALVRLGAVPRAAVRRAQKAQDLHEVVKIETRLFQERDLVQHEHAGTVVCFLAVELVKLDFFRPAAAHEKGVRLVAEQVAQAQFHVARHEVAVDVVHGKRQAQARPAPAVRGNRRAVAGGNLCGRKRRVRLGNAAKHPRVLFLSEKDLRGNVLGDAAVHTVHDVPLFRLFRHGGGELFVEGIEVAAALVYVVERGAGRARREDRLRGGRFARAQDDFCTACDGIVSSAGQVLRTASQPDDGEHDGSSV